MIDTLLPTPCAQQSGNTPEEHLRKKPGRGRVTDLAILVENNMFATGGKLPPGPPLLPTPCAQQSGPDFARASRPGSGGDDLVTTVCRATRGDLDWGKYEPAIRRWEGLTRPAPYPVEPNTKGNPRLAAAFSEWMMGWPEGWVTDLISDRRNDPDGISRSAALKIIGNGVCPQQAAQAIRDLLAA